jgi:hypothetical protein
MTVRSTYCGPQSAEVTTEPHPPQPFDAPQPSQPEYDPQPLPHPELHPRKRAICASAKAGAMTTKAVMAVIKVEQFLAMILSSSCNTRAKHQNRDVSIDRASQHQTKELPRSSGLALSN